MPVKLRYALGGLLVTAGAAFLLFWLTAPDLDALLAQGETALAKGDVAAAQQFADRVLAHKPDSSEGLLLKGRISARQGRHTQALEAYSLIPDDAGAAAVEARCAAGDLLLFEFKHLSDAETQYRRAIATAPDHVLAHDRLSYLLGLSSRNWESVPHRLRGIRQGTASIDQLYALSLGERVLENPETVAEYHRARPEDAAAQLGLGRVAFEIRKYADAERLLRSALATSPGLAEAHVRLGRLLETDGSRAKFLEWHAQVPKDVAAHPGIWFVRGLWANREDEPRVAARCFWEAVRRDPSDPQANYQLGRTLVGMEATGKSARPTGMESGGEAAPFLERARLLEAYVKAAEVAFHTREDAALQKTAQLAERCGLLHEAYGWSQAAIKENAGSGWASQTAERLKQTLPDLPLVRAVPEANPAAAVDLSRFPLPQWSDAGDEPSPEAFTPQPLASVSFENQASAAGLNFHYFNAGEPATKGIVMMYEVVGGGAAVLDYDGDGWPDVCFAQGCPWPVQPDQQEFIDRLFRNTGDGRFEDVTESARLRSNGFSQGASVGDFDNDGFPDLYINNIGQNRLYHNNGDGTFTDVTGLTGTTGERYTVSSVIADLNGDGLPDIYAVNYLSGDDLFTKICGDGNEIQASCLPHIFPAEQDQLYLNLGDGRFEEVTEESGIVVEGGKGLGIVAADFDGSGRLNLFVANDVSPNFYFVNETEQPGGRPRFSEQGLVRGLALNFSGQHESAMGVAAGDADGDGLLDLYATNFDNETNTLYRQRPGGLFEDVTAQAGLGEKKAPYVGWGTQFLDADLDGRPDLILTNGHINDLRPSGKPYQMPPQFYQNIGNGRFREVSVNSLGAFFQGEYLGRGMARLDWNRDGREDVVISHLDAPAALLTNTTSGAGRWLAVRLAGGALSPAGQAARQSARDAIGATVTVTAGRHKWVRQLTAGDGNQASNERKLVFGLGDARKIDKLEIRWPSGLRQEFADVVAEQELLLIEGRPQPIVIVE